MKTSVSFRPNMNSVLGWHRPLMANALIMSILVAVCAIGLFVDDRLLMGESVWVKPLKFGFAFAVYSVTLAWLLTKLRKGKRFGWWVGTVYAVFGTLDVIAVAIAAARGTFSHFNNQDDFWNQLVQNIFSYGVPPLLLTSLIIAILLLVQRTGDLALSIALRVGLLLATASMVVAFWLIGASYGPERTRVDANGNADTTSLGHSIGGDPDGSGMPLTNWSTTGGDLRVPHFLGLHGIQVLLLCVMLLAFLAARVPLLSHAGVRAGLVGAASLGYTGVFAVTTWQAYRGQSLIHPDSATLLATAGVVLLTLAVAVAALAFGRRRTASPELVAAV